MHIREWLKSVGRVFNRIPSFGLRGTTATPNLSTPENARPPTRPQSSQLDVVYTPLLQRGATDREIIGFEIAALVGRSKKIKLADYPNRRLSRFAVASEALRVIESEFGEKALQHIYGIESVGKLLLNPSETEGLKEALLTQGLSDLAEALKGPKNQKATWIAVGATIAAGRIGFGCTKPLNVWSLVNRGHQGAPYIAEAITIQSKFPAKLPSESYSFATIVEDNLPTSIDSTSVVYDAELVTTGEDGSIGLILSAQSGSNVHWSSRIYQSFTRDYAAHFLYTLSGLQANSLFDNRGTSVEL